MKRKVSLKALDYQKVEEASGATARQLVKLVAGISKEKATELNKHLKALGLKHQRSVLQQDNPAIRGMIFKVRHLVEVTEREGQE